MEYRAYISVRRPGGLTLDEDLDILRQLDLRHEELGPVGAAGGDVENAQYILSTDRYDDPAAAVAEMVAAVADAVARAGITGAYPTAVELEPAEKLSGEGETPTVRTPGLRSAG